MEEGTVHASTWRGHASVGRDDEGRQSLQPRTWKKSRITSLELRQTLEMVFWFMIYKNHGQQVNCSSLLDCFLSYNCITNSYSVILKNILKIHYPAMEIFIQKVLAEVRKSLHRYQHLSDSEMRVACPPLKYRWEE